MSNSNDEDSSLSERKLSDADTKRRDSKFHFDSEYQSEKNHYEIVQNDYLNEPIKMHGTLEPKNKWNS